MSRASTYENCRLWFCNDEHYGRGLCARHYQWFMRRKRAGEGNGYSPHTRELFTLLQAIKEFRKIAKELSTDNLVLGPIFVQEGYPGFEFRECKVCGAVLLIGNDGTKKTPHNPGCPVERAETMLNYTEMGPEEVLGEPIK